MPYNVLPFRAKAMRINGHSAIPKAPASLEPHDQIVSVLSRTLIWGWSYPSVELQSVYSIQKNKNKRKQKYKQILAPWKRIKNAVNRKIKIKLFVVGEFWTVSRCLAKGLKLLEIRWRIDSILTASFLRTATLCRGVLDTWEDLVSYTPGKDHQLTLVWKTRKDENKHKK